MDIYGITTMCQVCPNKWVDFSWIPVKSTRVHPAKPQTFVSIASLLVLRPGRCWNICSLRMKSLSLWLSRYGNYQKPWKTIRHLDTLTTLSQNRVPEKLVVSSRMFPVVQLLWHKFGAHPPFFVDKPIQKQALLLCVRFDAAVNDFWDWICNTQSLTQHLCCQN